MEIYFQLIKDAETLRKACEDLQKEDVLGFDTETTALDPYDGELRLVQLSIGRDTKVIDLKPFAERGDLRTSAELAPLRDLLAAPRPIKIAHNAKFDAKWVSHHLGVKLGGTFDTLLASQIIAAGDQDRRHSLAEVTSHFLGTELDKSEQVSDWSAAELSQSQVEYAAKDAATMIPLREKIVERLKSDDLIKVAKLEFDCVMPIAQMELNGFYLDAARWREQLEKVKVEQGKVALELQQMLSAGVAQASLFGVAEINLDSQTQVTDALKNLGVPVPETTRGWQLQPLAIDYPVVGKLLEYRGVAKSLSSFGENILDFINPKTGRIHADFRQIGAPTGRFSCLSADTLVSVSSGLKRIDKVCEGDLVKTSFGYKRVLKAWSNGLRQTYQVTLSDGRKIRATRDHLFLTGRANEWKQLSELKVGDDLYASLKNFDDVKSETRVSPFDFTVPDFRARKSVKIPQKLSVELCEFLGLAFADGFLGKRQIRANKKRRWQSSAAEYDRLYIAFNPQDEDLANKIVRIGENLFGFAPTEINAKTCRLFQFASTRLAEFFARLGLTNRAQSKTIPETILNSPARFQTAFLRGLFEGDGHRHENGSQRVVGLVGVNLPMLLCVQIMLSNLGIHSTVRERKDASGFSGNTRYALEITKKSGIERFMSKIGFLSKRKNRRFSISQQIIDGVATPFVVKGAELYREAVAVGATTASRIGVKPFIQFYKNPAIKAETVSKLVGKFDVLPSLKPVLNYIDLGVRQVKIKSIEPFAVEEVFDLTVEDVHQFIANGIVVHNCSRPNIQQIPHEEAYRRCFRAPDGRKLIIADYSQVELRILAEFSNDQNFIKAFVSGEDFHTTTAAQVFNVKPEEVTSEQRSFAKRLNFGVVYGIGSQRFALMTGVSQSTAEDIMRKYFATYRGLDAWLRDAARKVTTDRQARTASGRLARFRFDEADRKAISLAQRNGKNMPIQGTSADVLKRALHLLQESIKDTSIRLVNIVHDEVILEADAAEAEIAADKLEKAMCAAGEEYISKVPVKVDVHVADEWTK